MELPGTVVGVGVDVVGIERFTRVLERTPTFVRRIFTERESLRPDGELRPAQSLAARFAAKEAVAKVLVETHGLRWHDCEVVADDHGFPQLQVSGSVLAAGERLGITHWHLTLSHDAGVAIAFVIGERRAA